MYTNFNITLVSFGLSQYSTQACPYSNERKKHRGSVHYRNTKLLNKREIRVCFTCQIGLSTLLTAALFNLHLDQVYVFKHLNQANVCCPQP